MVIIISNGKDSKVDKCYNGDNNSRIANTVNQNVVMLKNNILINLLSKSANNNNRNDDDSVTGH